MWISVNLLTRNTYIGICNFVLGFLSEKEVTASNCLKFQLDTWSNWTRLEGLTKWSVQLCAVPSHRINYENRNSWEKTPRKRWSVSLSRKKGHRVSACNVTSSSFNAVRWCCLCRRIPWMLCSVWLQKQLVPRDTDRRTCGNCSPHLHSSNISLSSAMSKKEKTSAILYHIKKEKC